MSTHAQTPKVPGAPETQETPAGRGFGVYLHWPYCAAICPYCDFNVYRDRAAVGDDGAHRDLIDAMCADLRAHADHTEKRPVGSVFFGGGTPSRLPASAVSELLAQVDAVFGLAAGAEISMEFNPEDVTAARADALAGAGVTRASLGVQSLHDQALSDLGRHHDAAQALAAIETARSAFASVSIDVIYARSHQSLDDWRNELAQIVTLGVDHLSLYQLTIEPGTAFEKAVRRGARPAPDPDVGAAFYEATEAAARAAGFDAYEVSNHARSPAARSGHNLTYWRSGEWIGVGPGAHGRLGPLGPARRATTAPRRPQAYVAATRGGAIASQGRVGGGAGAGSGDPGCGEVETLSPLDQLSEVLLMGLRTHEGVPVSRLEDAAGGPVNLPSLSALLDDGLITADQGRLVIPARGRLLTDAVAGALLSDLS